MEKFEEIKRKMETLHEVDCCISAAIDRYDDDDSEFYNGATIALLSLKGELNSQMLALYEERVECMPVDII